MLRVAYAIVVVIIGFGIWWAFSEGPLRDPEEALQDFYNTEGSAVDQFKDPLILNGRRVVPLVLDELPNKNMRLRRYAIQFLGDGRYESALPALEKILADESEVYYFRTDALKAIYQIVPERALVLAKAYVKSEASLGEVARTIADGTNPEIPVRTYWQAFRHFTNQKPQKQDIDQ
jgi:HEAT repeat protein